MLYDRRMAITVVMTVDNKIAIRVKLVTIGVFITIYSSKNMIMNTSPIDRHSNIFSVFVPLCFLYQTM